MVELGNASTITIIILSIILIIVFSVNIYYSRKAQQRAIDLAADGVNDSDISDPTNILYITNILGILLSIIILGILIYVYVKKTSIGDKLITDVKTGVASIPTRIKTYTATTENVE
jgi:cytochrome c biogenesis factor